jgi:hypothetical protein
MKKVTESASSNKRRLFVGVRPKARELKSHDFAVGTRGNELYFA